AVMQGVDGEIFVTHTYSALGRVLRDADFAFPPAVDAIPEGTSERWSAERLPDLDADVIFLTYRNDAGQTPADAITAMEAVLPTFCDILHACREGQMVILPRDEATSASYDALMALSLVVLSEMTSNEIVRRAE
ncbi:MAG: iron-siderophore ABC transporter substrate-binding protein, partial [Pseudomonadota bacterium]